ncbi:hypothetical protein Desaci_4254 [Desulfosporosinus acidiphilus SJ4]|uniref:Uncharacterized protein n=1 Tax=Desulfosporosinus acidiphilus (strain DSM 22704 / JCM 16185 / SJ4) TaxID=646529 RepID=I4DBD7_DESAJ|nr:hypothetical protein Desaci_4254 [Desulfosporosinus acidiphilus SJ4]
MLLLSLYLFIGKRFFYFPKGLLKIGRDQDEIHSFLFLRFDYSIII